MTRVELGNYFIVTSGYNEKGGLVNKTREALLFLSEEGECFRMASDDEIEIYAKMHPILR
ncbi:MAG: hypothetical protein P8H03_06880 [Emcibacteraceae bacterium]|nr:hypothetical protein [Emcibacteraceae bacterium]MDG1857493.1 hypothetical protein [Emcibacteraceae bacterium]